MSLARIPRRRVPVACANEKFSFAAGHLSPATRQRIGDAIDTLLALLDAADGDAGLEDGHDAEAIDEREPDDEGDPLDLGEHDEAEIAERWHAVA